MIYYTTYHAFVLLWDLENVEIIQTAFSILKTWHKYSIYFHRTTQVMSLRP